MITIKDAYIKTKQILKDNDTNDAELFNDVIDTDFSETIDFKIMEEMTWLSKQNVCQSLNPALQCHLHDVMAHSIRRAFIEGYFTRKIKHQEDQKLLKSLYEKE